MILNDHVSFQEFQNLGAKYIPTVGGVTDLAYATMSMCGEAGEVAEKVKRIYRGDNEAKDPFYERQIAAELGDVLWCLAAVCTALDIPLEQVAVESLKKMDSRAKRGVLKGSGDNR